NTFFNVYANVKQLGTLLILSTHHKYVPPCNRLMLFLAPFGDLGNSPDQRGLRDFEPRKNPQTCPDYFGIALINTDYVTATKATFYSSLS
ncbi:MAG TPA: hypothetical protein VMG59_05945, partial [Phycisphaerae bacterium]|nr:hypothetical protein [Phycisphaerae bacterium]